MDLLPELPPENVEREVSTQIANKPVSFAEYLRSFLFCICSNESPGLGGDLQQLTTKEENPFLCCVVSPGAP